MGARDLGLRWAEVLDGAVAPTLTRARIEDLLTDLAEKLRTAVEGIVEADVARETAGALVAANYRDPLAVSRTIPLICGDIVDDLAPGDSERDKVRAKAVEVAAEFAAGFTVALRSAALAEQEATMSAVLSAAQESENRRQLSEARFAAVFAGASVGIGTIDVNGRVLDVNAALAEMLGIPAELIPGRSVSDLIGHDNVGSAYSYIRKLLAGTAERFRVEVDHPRPDGALASVDLSMSAVRDARGQVRFLIGVAVDITERKQLGDRLWHDANHDTLTGLPNRSLFLSRLAEAHPPIGVCYLDLNNFKEINDAWGHRVGDQVLRIVGERLRHGMEPVGGLAARLGGDEFMILVEDCPAEAEMARLCEQVTSSLKVPMLVDGRSFTIDASVGTVYLESMPVELDEVMHAADAAMYRNKPSGGRG